MLFNLLSLLLPALIPSWRFFKTVAPSPRIEVCLAGDWIEVGARPEQVSLTDSVGRLFWNPSWNEYLYMVSLSERQVAEPSEHSFKELSEHISGHLAARLPKGQKTFQFRLTFVSREGDQIVKYVEYESPHIVWEAAS